MCNITIRFDSIFITEFNHYNVGFILMTQKICPFCMEGLDEELYDVYPHLCTEELDS
jgi:hypothetical protein